MAFTSENQPQNRKPRGKGKKGVIADMTTEAALAKLAEAVEAGEPWAITLVIDRSVPKLKAITPPESLDGELLQAKITELTELEQRIAALEGIAHGKK